MQIITIVLLISNLYCINAACIWVFGGPKNASSCSGCDGLGKPPNSLPPAGTGTSDGSGNTGGNSQPTPTADPNAPPTPTLTPFPPGKSATVNPFATVPTPPPSNGVQLSNSESGDGASLLPIILGSVGGCICCCVLIAAVVFFVMSSQRSSSEDTTVRGTPSSPQYGASPAAPDGVDLGIYAAPVPAGGTYAAPVSAGGTYQGMTTTGSYQSSEGGAYVDLSVSGRPEAGGEYGTLEQKKDYLPDNTVYQPNNGVQQEPQQQHLAQW